MPKLNFYDTDAVKAFLLNTLVENKEVREDVDFERRQSQTWFTQYQAQKGRAEAAEAKIAAAVSVLTTPMPAHSTGTVTAEDVNQVIADALALLTGSLKTEGGAAKWRTPCTRSAPTSWPPWTRWRSTPTPANC